MPVDDDVPFDPWDDRTPAQVASYQAELDRVAEQSRDIQF